MFGHKEHMFLDHCLNWPIHRFGLDAGIHRPSILDVAHHNVCGSNEQEQLTDRTHNDGPSHNLILCPTNTWNRLVAQVHAQWWAGRNGHDGGVLGHIKKKINPGINVVPKSIEVNKLLVTIPSRASLRASNKSSSRQGIWWNIRICFFQGPAWWKGCLMKSSITLRTFEFWHLRTRVRGWGHKLQVIIRWLPISMHLVVDAEIPWDGFVAVQGRSKVVRFACGYKINNSLSGFVHRISGHDSVVLVDHAIDLIKATCRDANLMNAIWNNRQSTLIIQVKAYPRATSSKCGNRHWRLWSFDGQHRDQTHDSWEWHLNNQTCLQSIDWVAYLACAVWILLLISRSSISKTPARSFPQGA